MGALTIVPVLIIPVIIFNFLALGGQAEGVLSVMPFGVISMPTGGKWAFTLGDLLLAVSLVFLFWEVIRATSTKRESLINNVLSVGLFIVCLLEFVLLPAFAHSVFFIITLLTLLDAIAGSIVTAVTARRDFGVGEGFRG